MPARSPAVPLALEGGERVALGFEVYLLLRAIHQGILRGSLKAHAILINLSLSLSLFHLLFSLTLTLLSLARSHPSFTLSPSLAQCHSPFSLDLTYGSHIHCP